MISSPTGSGKSVILNAMQKVLCSDLHGVVLAPSIDILEGLFAKSVSMIPSGFDGLSETARRALMECYGYYTTRRYHNLLMGAAVEPPQYVLTDECHHDTDDTHQILRALAGNPPMVGVTATPYRGTPEETLKLRELWGEPYIALTLKAAVDRGIIARPDFSVWPLVDDERIAVSNGEFVTTAVESALKDKYDDVASRVLALPPRPTMVRAPGVASARLMGEAIERAGGRARVVTGESSAADRRIAFALASDARAILVQVKVVGEGVDLPLRRLVDLAPTMSPVAWQQALGRITRPTDGDRPEYITCCHNLIRHAYLWAGLIPSSQIAAAQKAWGPNFKPKRRTMARALGLEGFGKFIVEPVPMVDGSAGSLYALQTSDGLREYAVFLHPCMPDPLYFEKHNALTGERKVSPNGFEYAEKRWGKWRRIKGIPSAEGYLSVKPQAMHGKQQERWKELAGRYGLDPEAEPNARAYSFLPICWQTNTRFKPE